MYFQWQNKFLLQTIYPRRNRKLADFLIYTREIEIWQAYKDTKIEDLEQDVQEYIAEREYAVIAAYKSYKTEYEYFTRGDVRTRYVPRYKITDETDLAPIQELHRTFLDNLPKRQDVRKEKNFVAYYVSVWQQKLAKLREEEARLERRLAIILPEHRDRPVLIGQLQKLRNVTLPMLAEELERLIKFLSTYNKIEKRKLEFYKATEAAKAEIQGVQVRLDSVRAPLQQLEGERREIATALARIKSPPQRAAFEGYFSTEDVFDELCRQFPEADPALIQTVCSVHKRLAAELRALKSEDVKRVRLREYVDELRGQHRALATEVHKLEYELRGKPAEAAPGGKHTRLEMLRGAGLRAVESELDKLSDYHATYEYAQKPRTELDRMVKDQERDLQRKQDRIAQLKEQASALEAEYRAREAVLNMSEAEYLVRLPPGQPVTVRDIVRGKVEKYKNALEAKLAQDLPEETIQQELLEEIVQGFIKDPGRHPLWLQYMVIHFSGMRYATAHGSWADPKDLLTSLRTSALEKELMKLDEDAVEALSEQRVTAYESTDPARAPRLALATSQKWKDRIALHMRGLKSPSAHYRRKALFDLRMDEENYEVESMTPGEALEALKARQNTLPEWMWKEIVRLTDLRVQEAQDPDWNRLTPEQQDEKNEARYAEFRAIMNKWKQDNLTGWRQEHDRSNRLIVTSSVCNEVAEQIQHLRGNTPPGGLSYKPDWYMHTEGAAIKSGKSSGPPGPFFVRAQPGAERYFVQGASILWLRFVHDIPNPWRVAKPLATRQGDRLIPDAYRKSTAATGDWQYFESDMIKRTRQRTVEKKTLRDQQWLRWMHEATVAEVSETADGPTVLTFETALPYDDPSVSAVGIFKHNLQNLMWDGGEDNYNGAFIGYVPEGDLPVGDLGEMLDWNKILRRQVMTPSQLEEYRRKHIRAA
jgi:hypothetical protein